MGFTKSISKPSYVLFYCQCFPRGLYGHGQRNCLQNSRLFRRHHKGVEDFRITNDDGSKICIPEVKGKERDIMKPDLLKVEANGDAAGKDQALFLYSHHPHLVKIHQIHHRDIILMLLRRQQSTGKQQPCIGMNAHLRKSAQYLADPLYSDWDEYQDILRTKFIVAFGAI